MTPEKRVVFINLKKAMRNADAVYPENSETGIYNRFSFDGKTYTLTRHDKGCRSVISFLRGEGKPNARNFIEVKVKNESGEVATYEFTGLSNMLLRFRYLECVGKRL